MTTAVGADRQARWRRTLGEHADAHAAVRRRFGLAPEPDFADHVLAAYRPPDWAVGSIGVLDAMVLRDIVHGVRPDRVIELGTAAGTSALTLAAAMSETGRTEAACVRTYDLHPWCYFDRSRPVGSAIDEAPAALARLIRRDVRKAAIDAGRELAGAGIRLAFVDADHRHPMPTADLLALLPALAPGAWVVLHDIDLPAAAARYERAHGVDVDWKQHGAQWLFEAWPFEKITPGAHPNIGAIRIPDSGRVEAGDLQSCLRRPWETTPDAGVAALLAA
jgi:predicted O-methyltransferase YrrM